MKTDLFDEAKKMFLDQLTESVATTNADQHALLIIQREENARRHEHEKRIHEEEIKKAQSGAHEKMDDYVRVLSRRNANESLESGGITPPKKISFDTTATTVAILRSFFKSSFYTQGPFEISIGYTHRITNTAECYRIKVSNETIYFARPGKILAHHSTETTPEFNTTPTFYHLELYHNRIHLLRYKDGAYQTLLVGSDENFESDVSLLSSTTNKLCVHSSQPVYNLFIQGLARETHDTKSLESHLLSTMSPDRLLLWLSADQLARYYTSAIHNLTDHLATLSAQETEAQELIESHTLQITSATSYAIAELEKAYASGVTESDRALFLKLFNEFKSKCITAISDKGTHETNKTLAEEEITYYTALKTAYEAELAEIKASEISSEGLK